MTGDPNAALVDLLVTGATDEELLVAAAPHAVGDQTVEHLIIGAITLATSRRLPRDVRRHLQVRWYRRAVDDGQVWAMYEGGDLWAFAGSHGFESRIGKDVVSPEEAQQWIARAADKGMLRACLDAARWNPDDERAIGWLRTAYAGTESAEGLGRDEVSATALWLARLLDKTSDPEAGLWYRTAAECPPWQDSDIHGSSWPEAAGEYALWAHRQGNEALCSAWAYRVLENAANAGPGDRFHMAVEHKSYRNDWQLARHAESMRQHVIRHLITEHRLSPPQQLDVALLLSNSRWFGQDDWTVVRDGASTVGRSVAPEQAWATIHWLLAEAVPAVLCYAGLAQAAADFARLVPEVTASADRSAWLEEVQGSAGWQDLPSGEGPLDSERQAKRLIADVLERAGLGERASVFQTAGAPYREERVWADLHDTDWRLMRGEPAWFAMFCAAAAEGEADEWIGWWTSAGKVVALALRGALRVLGTRLGTDWSRDLDFDDPLRVEWQALGDSLAVAFADLAAVVGPA